MSVQHWREFPIINPYHDLAEDEHFLLDSASLQRPVLDFKHFEDQTIYIVNFIEKFNIIKKYINRI